MAQPANSFSTYDAKGLREDLQDTIFDISKTQTPFISAIARTKGKAVKHEWQTDALAAAADNAVIEGDDATTDAATATARIGNYEQILDKVIRVTGTQEAVDKAGRDSEISYQVAKRGKELKRDLELVTTGNYASVAGNNTLARHMGGFCAWITSNDSRGAGGADGGYNSGTGVVDAATNGTQRAFTEALLKAVLLSIWTNSNEAASMVLVGGFNKQIASTFSGIATQYRENSGVKQGVILGAADVYISDFGEVKIIADAFAPTRSAEVVNPDYWALATLRPMFIEELAKTGDSTQKQLLMETTLVSRNQASSGVVADLTTS